MQLNTVERHPLPWSVLYLGDTSAIVDSREAIVIELPWDGLEEGGVNAALEALCKSVNT